MDVRVRHQREAPVSRLPYKDGRRRGRAGTILRLPPTTYCLPPRKMFASAILVQDIREYAPLFSGIADAHHDERRYTVVVSIYEELGQGPSVSNADPHLHASLTCYRNRLAVSLFQSGLLLVVE